MSKGFNYCEELLRNIMLMVILKTNDSKIKHKGGIVYAADLPPTAGHIPVPYIMGYVRPLITMVENDFQTKRMKMSTCFSWSYDPHHQLVFIKTEKGIRFDKSFSINEL